MQEAKNFLQSEKERIQRETARYTKLAQTASASIEIIFDPGRGWREVGHSVDNQYLEIAARLGRGQHWSVAHLFGDPRSSPARTCLPSPISGKALSMPTYHGLRLD